MAKVLKFKDVTADVEKRMKEFEKLRTKLKDARAKEAKKEKSTKENTGILKSISNFFSDNSKLATPVVEKK